MVLGGLLHGMSATCRHTLSVIPGRTDHMSWPVVFAHGCLTTKHVFPVRQV